MAFRKTPQIWASGGAGCGAPSSTATGAELGAREPRRRPLGERTPIAKHAVGPESDGGAERRHLAEPAVAEVDLGAGRADGDRRKDDRDRRRRAHVVDGEL